MNTFVTITENTRWMLVDDNIQILSLLSTVLKQFTGAEIECYQSPKTALATFQAEPGKYELVITDFDMPEMDGAELCRRLREVTPDVEIFLATGSRQFTPETAYEAGFSALLDKPFQLASLQEALSAAGLESEQAFAE